MPLQRGKKDGVVLGGVCPPQRMGKVAYYSVRGAHSATIRLSTHTLLMRPRRRQESTRRQDAPGDGRHSL